MNVPVEYDASSDSSHRIARATSIASPPRCIGSVGPSRSTRPGSPPLGVDLGVDDPGPDAVDADPLGGNLARQPDRQRVERGLRRRVVDVLAGRAELRRPRRDVDDRAAAAAVPGRHPPHRFTRADERAASRWWRTRERCAPRRSRSTRVCGSRIAGVVDQRGERPSIAIDGFEQPHDVGLDRDVGLHRDRAAAAARDRPRRPPPRPRFAAQVVHADGVAAFGGEPRRRARRCRARRRSRSAPLFTASILTAVAQEQSQSGHVC